jgi:hypothetical protein
MQKQIDLMSQILQQNNLGDRIAKKLDASSDDSNLNTVVLLDTTSRVTDAIKTWTQVFDVLEHEIINCPDESTEEDDESYTTKLRHVAQSELHKIATRPRIMPYNDMISWALEHVDM